MNDRALPDISRLLKDAALSMKSDAKGTVARLEAAYSLARVGNPPHEAAAVAEELARGWARRRSQARSVHYAVVATELAPERKEAWTTLAKTCELVAARMSDPQKRNRACVLYRAAGAAFKRAAGLTKDPEDKRWLLELAADATKQAR